jgi:hypothetical protein
LKIVEWGLEIEHRGRAPWAINNLSSVSHQFSDAIEVLRRPDEDFAEVLFARQPVTFERPTRG